MPASPERVHAGGSSHSAKAEGQKRLAPFVALAAAASFWSTGFLFGKVALAETTVGENVSWRFVIASLLLLPVLLRQPLRMPTGDRWRLLVAAIAGIPVEMLIQFAGLARTTVSHASLMVGTLPVLVAAGSVLFLRERLAWRGWAVLGASAVGAALIAMSQGSSAAASLQGDLLVLGSMLAAVVNILLMKRLADDHDPLAIAAAMIMLGTIVLVPYVALTTGLRWHFSARTWLAFAGQGAIATAAAYTLWNWGVSRVPASRAGVFLNMEPLLGALLGVAILHEQLGPGAVLGGALIVASAVYFSRRQA